MSKNTQDAARALRFARKLTPGDVVTIRFAYQHEGVGLKALAAGFGVSWQMIALIVARRAWKWVT